MAWNYSGNPSASSRDWVRFRVGDTQTADQQLSDEEIASLLADADNAPRRASLYAARRLAAKYARLVDNNQGVESNAYSKRQDAYKALIKEIQAEIDELGPGVPPGDDPSGTAGGGGIRFTGLSRARRDAVRAEPDRIQPPAYRGQWSQGGQDDDP